jgi:hypothetical protein
MRLEITRKAFNKLPACLPFAVEDVFQVCLIDLQSLVECGESDVGHFDPGQFK